VTAPAGQKIYGIICNPKLFMEWRELGEWVKNVGCIVQNDMELPKSDVKLWMEEVMLRQKQLDSLARRTLEYMKMSPGDQYHASSASSDKEIVYGISLDPESNADGTELIY
jgi:hypothetical protein